MIGLPRAASFEVRRGRLGWGIVARGWLRPGRRILAFSGPLIDFAGTLAKGEREGDALQIDEDLYLDLDDPGRLVNHSCDPNAGIVAGRILVAVRDVAPEEEIVYDYSTTRGDGNWTMVCCCGSPSCRGVIGDFAHLDGELRERYLRLGIVQEYLRSRLTAQPQVAWQARGAVLPEGARC